MRFRLAPHTGRWLLTMLLTCLFASVGAAAPAVAPQPAASVATRSFEQRLDEHWHAILGAIRLLNPWVVAASLGAVLLLLGYGRYRGRRQ